MNPNPYCDLPEDLQELFVTGLAARRWFPYWQWESVYHMGTRDLIEVVHAQ